VGLPNTTHCKETKRTHSTGYLHFSIIIRLSAAGHACLGPIPAQLPNLAKLVLKELAPSLSSVSFVPLAGISGARWRPPRIRVQSFPGECERGKRDKQKTRTSMIVLFAIPL
jgi:hypothetical protein